MKYKLIVIVAVLSLGIGLLLARSHPLVSADFATSALLKYHYWGKNIDVKVADEKDITVLKNVLVGRSYGDNPSCGFTTDVSITLTNGQQSIIFCPACDNCSVVRIGTASRYIDISKKGRKQLEAVLAKYGMVFPCV